LLMEALKKYAYDNKSESGGNVRKVREAGPG
jgi:hypothetical protein